MKEKKEFSQHRYEKFKLHILSSFSLLIIAVSLILAFIIGDITKRTFSEEVTALIVSSSRQLEMNINNYFNRVERNATLLFSDDNYYLYDATDASIEDYDKIQYEDAIQSRIVDLGLMENYSDFGVIYSNNHTVGWISNSVQSLFQKDGLYESFSPYVAAEGRESKWVFGVGGNMDRMFYIKRLNPNAIMLVAFYTHELESMFRNPEGLEDMVIRLMDKDNRIVYSLNNEEIGTSLSDELADMVGQNLRVAGYSKDYLVKLSTCENGFRVINIMPTKAMMHNITSLCNNILMIAICIGVICIGSAVILLRRLSVSVDGMVTDLKEQATVDTLSGCLNKTAFREKVEKKVKEEKIHVLCMLDADNFKRINDTLGHAYGDNVIARFGNLLTEVFFNSAIVGRVGGDEFAVYTDIEGDRESVVRRVTSKLDYLYREFGEEFVKEAESCKLSLSCGVRVVEGKYDYKVLFSEADEALYISKNNGKKQYTFFKEEADHE